MTGKIDMSKLTIPAAEAEKFTFTKPQENNIVFFNTMGGTHTEVLRITKDGITANPNVPTDEAADAVIRALDGHIKNLVKREWVELTVKDMPDGDNPMFDTDEFALGVAWAQAKLKEKNT
jgi:hypothetical protein